MRSSGGFPPGDFFAYSKKSDPAVSGFLLFEKQIYIGVKDVDGVKTTNRHPKFMIATVYKGNIIKNLIMDCQSYTKYRPNETTGGIFVSWRRKEELPTGA